MRFTNWLIVKAIIPKVSNRFFIYGFMMSKKNKVPPTEEREKTDTRPRNEHK
jgi:hypothetical protein